MHFSTFLNKSRVIENKKKTKQIHQICLIYPAGVGRFLAALFCFPVSQAAQGHLMDFT